MMILSTLNLFSLFLETNTVIFLSNTLSEAYIETDYGDIGVIEIYMTFLDPPYS